MVKGSRNVKKGAYASAGIVAIIVAIIAPFLDPIEAHFGIHIGETELNHMITAVLATGGIGAGYGVFRHTNERKMKEAELKAGNGNGGGTAAERHGRDIARAPRGRAAGGAGGARRPAAGRRSRPARAAGAVRGRVPPTPTPYTPPARLPPSSRLPPSGPRPCSTRSRRLG